MKIGLPAGIGDFSWAWSKLCTLENEITEIQIADGWPYRTVPYVELCVPPHVSVSYGAFNYHTIQMNTRLHDTVNPTAEQLRALIRETQMILLEPNFFLEERGRLEGWMPDLPTNFNYPIRFGDLAKRRASAKLSQINAIGPMVGISCASYRGSEAWKTWGAEEWKRILLKMLRHGFQPVILGGFWDDLSNAVAEDLALPDLVGKTSVEEMVALMDLLPYYVGFSSGMNVIRSVLGRNAFALWPKHQLKLSTSWVPQQQLDDRVYVASQWLTPEVVWPVMRRFLEENSNAKGQEVPRKEHSPQGLEDEGQDAKVLR